MTREVPGRACPLRYRYGVDALAKASERYADTLYVVGGLYGNVEALDAVEALARIESRPAVICFAVISQTSSPEGRPLYENSWIFASAPFDITIPAFSSPVIIRLMSEESSGS